MVQARLSKPSVVLEGVGIAAAEQRRLATAKPRGPNKLNMLTYKYADKERKGQRDPENCRGSLEWRKKRTTCPCLNMRNQTHMSLPQGPRISRRSRYERLGISLAVVASK